MQSTAADDTFEDIDDATTRVILGLSLLDVGQMLLDEQQKKRGGGVSEWEQALVTHGGELRRGLAALKESTTSHCVAHSTTVDENAAVVVQERVAQNDRAIARRFGGLPDLSQQAVFAAPTPPQKPHPSSQDTTIQTSIVLQDVANGTQASVPQVPASSEKRLLESATEVELPNSKHVDTGIHKDVYSQGLPKPAEKPMRSIHSDMGMTRTPKRRLDEAGFDEQSNAKRVDTGKKKGNDLNLKHLSEEVGKYVSIPLPKRRATPKSRRKVGTRRMR